MKALLFAIAALGVACAADVASAAPADSCRLCRESHQACIKNHSKDACRNELDICTKHCRRP
jgi:hypothetical protein